MNDSEPVVHDEFYKSLLSDFLGESEQLLVALDENLTRLAEWVHSLADERQPPCAENLLSALFRSAHSLKGLSNMLGLDEIERLVELVQHVFDAARKDELALTGDVVELLFDAVDRVASLIDALKDPDAPAVPYEDVVERIVALLRPCSVQPDPGGQADAERTLGRIESQVAEMLSGMTAPCQAAAAVSPPPVPRAAPAARRLSGAVAASGADRAPGKSLEGVTDEADMSSRFIPIFIDETGMALDQLTESLLALESGDPRDAIKRLLVVAHRIKGSAASIGLHRAAKLSHLMEDVLQDRVNTGKTLSTDAIDVMLKCVDELRRYVDGLKQGAIPADDFGRLAAELLVARQMSSTASPSASGAVEHVVGSAPEPNAETAGAGSMPSASATAYGKTAPAACPEPAVEASAASVPESLRKQVLAAAPIGIPVFAGVATFQPDLPLAGLKAELLYEKLSGLGQ